MRHRYGSGLPAGNAWTVAVASISILLCCGSFAPASNSYRPPTSLLWLDGPSQTASVEEEFTVTVRLDDVSDVYGVVISLSFDETSLEVLDDGGSPGIQISVGDCPKPDFVVQNAADNAAGTIDYAVTQLNPTPPCNGGVAALVRFRGLQTGTTEIQIVESVVSDPDGLMLPHGTQNLSVDIGGSPVALVSWGTVKALYR